jgi:hypothetical protein
MVYQYRVHKKVKFNRKDRINAGKNPVWEKIAGAMYWYLIIVSAILFAFLAIYPITVALIAEDYCFFVFYCVVILLLTGLIVVGCLSTSERNATLTLSETEARFEEDPVRGKCFCKYTVSYDRVCKVYHTDLCPTELTPMVKNRKNPVYDRELWQFYNGSYIVAEDCNDNLLFGAVYNEEMWNVLKKYCKNATFYTKEEYLADIEKKRELDRKHDEYSKKYDGYVN